MQTIKDWYLGGMVPTQDDAEFERKHPRKGGKFAKKGEGGGVPTKSEEQKQELIKRNVRFIDGVEKLGAFVDQNGTEVKNGADYSRRIELLMKNRELFEIDGFASVKAEARIGEFGNFILTPSKPNGSAEAIVAKCEYLGLGTKLTDKGNVQVYMKKATDFSKMSDADLGKAHADALKNKNAMLARKIQKEQDSRLAKKAESVMKELDDEIKEYKDSIERVKSGETLVFNEEKWIKESEEAIKQYEMVKDFINEHGALVKTEGAYSKRIDFLAKNADALGIKAVAPIVGGSRVGKFGTCFIDGNARHEHICKVLGLSCKKIGDGLFKVYVGDDAK